MTREEIATIKAAHRSDVTWLNGAVRFGCTCGHPLYPCPRLADAREAEQRMADSMRNAGRFS